MKHTITITFEEIEGVGYDGIIDVDFGELTAEAVGHLYGVAIALLNNSVEAASDALLQANPVDGALLIAGLARGLNADVADGDGSSSLRSFKQ